MADVLFYGVDKIFIKWMKFEATKLACLSGLTLVSLPDR